MAVSPSSTIELTIGHNPQAPRIVFTKDHPLLDLLSQTHEYTERMLYVVNNVELGWYDDLQQVPRGGYRRDKIAVRWGTSLYHLKKIGSSETLVCCNALLAERLTAASLR
jgi:hypothetical protein